MLDQAAFTVEVMAANGKDWIQSFALREQAGLYLRKAGDNPGLTVVSHNFTQLSWTALDVFEKLEAEVTENARRLEKQARKRSNMNFHNSDSYPCEVCGKAHSNYLCCERCNYGNHRCHFCGDDLGHSEVSMCYIMLDWEENYARLSQT